MMRILTVSDVVEPEFYPGLQRDRLGRIDLILSCGDLAPEYLSYLMHVLNAPLYYVRGNHDIRYAQKPPEGCVDMHARLVRFRGLRLLGLEGSMWYNGGPHQYREHEMRHLLWKLRPRLWWGGGVDIVITHAPPRGIGDGEDLCHRGFESFRWLIRKYRPRYFIHGHIHKHFTRPQDRYTRVDDTQVVNTYGHLLLEIEA